MMKSIAPYNSKTRAIELLIMLAVMAVLLWPHLPQRAPYIAYDKYQGHVSNSDAQYYVTRFTLFNGSLSEMDKAEIDPDNPIALHMADKDPVFFCQIINTSNREQGFVSKYRKETGVAEIAFDHLRPGDKAVLAVYHHVPVEMEITGALRNGEALRPQKDVPPVLGIPFALYSAWLVIVGVGQLILLYVRHVQRRDGQTPFYFPNPVLLLDKKRNENFDPRKRLRFTLWFYRNWPLTNLVIWLAAYGCTFYL